MQSFDVIIAGGGPGGLSAAEAAAKAGASVLVLEQNKEIGSPARTTGGSFVQDMKALGIPESLYHPIRRCRYISPHNSAAFEYDEPVTCIYSKGLPRLINAVCDKCLLAGYVGQRKKIDFNMVGRAQRELEGQID